MELEMEEKKCLTYITSALTLTSVLNIGIYKCKTSMECLRTENQDKKVPTFRTLTNSTLKSKTVLKRKHLETLAKSNYYNSSELVK